MSPHEVIGMLIPPIEHCGKTVGRMEECICLSEPQGFLRRSWMFWEKSLSISV